MFFPFFCEIRYLLRILSDNYNTKDIMIYEGLVGEENDQKTISITDGKKAQVISACKIIDEAEILDNKIAGNKCYIISTEGKYYADDQTIVEEVYNLEKIFNRCLDYETACSISKASYDETVKRISLHRKGLSETVKGVFDDTIFEEQVYYRILHNMIFYCIKQDSVDDYFDVINGHQVLSFSDITDDQYFMMNDEHTLYVPKNGHRAGSALDSIYDNYLCSQAKRNRKDLYDSEINISEGKYTRWGSSIDKIVILTDNFEKGGQTIRLIKAYLEIELEDNRVLEECTRIQRYRCANREVTLKDIVIKNNCDIEIHGFFGTDEGKKNIEESLDLEWVKVKATYTNVISVQMIDLKQKASRFFNIDKIHDDAYAVIREFNMTKSNLFPIEMLHNSNKAITLFLKKEEPKIKTEDRTMHQNNNEPIGDVFDNDGIESMIQFFSINGFSDQDKVSASNISLFSVLPPKIRIKVLEGLIDKNHNHVVLEKLAKAYAKDGNLNLAIDAINDWIKCDYISIDYASDLKSSAEMLYSYRGMLPVNEDIGKAKIKFEELLPDTNASEEFVCIMKKLLGYFKYEYN